MHALFSHSACHVLQCTVTAHSLGCEVFSPPTRGAFACLRSPETIYCTVLCDHRFEFSSTPNNPYYCGQETGFNWRVFPDGLIQQSLPECTGQWYNNIMLLAVIVISEHFMITVGGGGGYQSPRITGIGPGKRKLPPKGTDKKF